MNLETLANDPINSIVLNDAVNEFNHGLTKREYFAAMAMKGLASSYHALKLESVRWQARKSIEMADELIKALNETK
jgi:hypothetical protein